jgi:hypothetical protein
MAEHSCHLQVPPETLLCSGSSPPSMMASRFLPGSPFFNLSLAHKLYSVPRNLTLFRDLNRKAGLGFLEVPEKENRLLKALSLLGAEDCHPGGCQALVPALWPYLLQECWHGSTPGSEGCRNPGWSGSQGG